MALEHPQQGQPYELIEINSTWQHYASMNWVLPDAYLFSCCTPPFYRSFRVRAYARGHFRLQDSAAGSKDSQIGTVQNSEL